MVWRTRSLGLLLIASLACAAPPVAVVTPEPAKPSPPDPEDELAMFAYAVRAALARDPDRVDTATLPPMLAASAAPVHVVLRSDGTALADTWQQPDAAIGPLTWHLLTAAIASSLATLEPDQAARVTTVQIELTHDAQDYDPSDPAQLDAFLARDSHGMPLHMGIRGEIVSLGDKTRILAPTTAISSNERLTWALIDLTGESGFDAADLQTAELHSFQAAQYLVELDAARATPMFRGNQIVDVASVDARSTEALVSGAATSLVNNVDEWGEQESYFYSPTHLTKSRQGADAAVLWNSINAMLRWAEHRDDPALFELVADAIEWNLGTMFRFEGDLGVLQFEGMAKLGAHGIAGLALTQHPERARWTKQVDGLLATIDRLAYPEGHFKVELKHTSSGFISELVYPGQAMLLWASRYAETKDAQLLARYQRAVEVQCADHREAPYPLVFAPWHLRGLDIVLDALAGSEPKVEAKLRKLVFELADLLVSAQQWGDPAYPDEWGRFYAPDKDWGVPDAPTTGACVWGLVAAYRVATRASDDERARDYRVAIVRGLRSLMQLQFVDDVDMFYVPVEHRDMLRGALRTGVTDNWVRLDSQSHAVLAGLDVLATFSEVDYVIDD